MKPNDPAVVALGEPFPRSDAADCTRSVLLRWPQALRIMAAANTPLNFSYFMPLHYGQQNIEYRLVAYCWPKAARGNGYWLRVLDRSFQNKELLKCPTLTIPQ